MDKELFGKLNHLLKKELFINLMDMANAQALKAHVTIRDHTELKGKNQRAAEGQIRFRMLEQSFQSICEAHGAVLLTDTVVSGKEIRFHQPFMRFGGQGDGVILAMASMPSSGKLPSKNKSRAAGVSLNYMLTPRLALDAADPKPGDVFVMFLIARDPAKAGHIEEMAVGIVDSNYDSYISYTTVESFMALYAEVNATRPAAAAKRLVKLKRASKAYKPPESA